jgi:hypothetical protein
MIKSNPKYFKKLVFHLFNIPYIFLVMMNGIKIIITEQKLIKLSGKAKAKSNSKATSEYIIQNRSFKLIWQLF